MTLARAEDLDGAAPEDLTRRAICRSAATGS
jgi:hypothetical protein